MSLLKNARISKCHCFLLFRIKWVFLLLLLLQIFMRSRKYTFFILEMRFSTFFQVVWVTIKMSLFPAYGAAATNVKSGEKEEEDAKVF